MSLCLALKERLINALHARNGEFQRELSQRVRQEEG
jgi:hypothetical protein